MSEHEKPDKARRRQTRIDELMALYESYDEMKKFILKTYFLFLKFEQEGRGRKPRLRSGAIWHL